MLGDFLTRILIMLVGYAYPAFECYKTVEKNKIEIERLRFWCQYWIIVAILTVTERFTDFFISWLPMYGEMKLVFFVYLWYPKTKGTSYVYATFLKPYLSKHETEIDRKVLELKARAWDMFILYWQNFAAYGQTTFFQILQYLAAQSSKAKENAFQKPSAPSTGAPPAPPSPKATDSPTYLRKQPTSPSTVIKRSVSQRSKTESVTLQKQNTEKVVVHEKNLSVGGKTSSSSSETSTVTETITNKVDDHHQQNNGTQESSGMDDTLRSALTKLRRSNSRPQ
ncbi:hypothetical protein MKW98_002122 [Papaver atlanticum]|uniref:HVA22-like protein n=1 Tax=Papaver atlanticum TaxID=357466 RepID=A0AAD4X3S6_9MAGN|nr:hypothetical protein MKW98_002122 [Papaver atlanticum]